MRRCGLIALGILVVSVALLPSAFAVQPQTVTSPAGVFNAGWNLFTLPAVARNPYPPAVMTNWDPGDGSGLDARLSRFDAITQSSILWDYWSEVPGSAFGNLQIGDGYWVHLNPGEVMQVQFQGITTTDSTDMCLPLPTTGWALIGNPYSYAVDWSTIQVTDGTQTVSMEYACRTEGWLQSLVYGFDSQHQNSLMVGLPDDFADTTLLPWHGYWVRSYRDNLALILTAQQ